MDLIKRANQGIKQLDVFDISLTKTGMIAFGLMVAKLWSPILSLSWYWYAIVFLLCSIRPLIHAFKS